MHINNKYRPTYRDPLRDIDCYTKLIAWKGCKAVHLLVLITLNDETENIFSFMIYLFQIFYFMFEIKLYLKHYAHE